MERLKCEFDYVFEYVKKEILRSEKIYQMAVSIFHEEDQQRLIQKASKDYYEGMRNAPDFRQGEYLYYPSFEYYLEDILETEELLLDL